MPGTTIHYYCTYRHAKEHLETALSEWYENEEAGAS
jgi:hypothetical protein